MSNIITINKNVDFRRVYARGKSFANPVLVSYCLKNRTGVCRIGITTSKKIGGAIERNRCRRIIKEAYRRLEPYCEGGWDIVFVARFKTLRVKSTDVEKVMREHLGNCGVITNDPLK